MAIKTFLRGFLIFPFILLCFKVPPMQCQDVLYYGFFFDEETAKSIKSVTDLYLNLSLEQIPEFKIFLESSSETANVSDVQKYFTKPLDPNTLNLDPYYHVTAKYCGDGDCSAYSKQIAPSLNKIFEMELIGFFFTNRTYGIRINLTEEQEKLFDNNRKFSTYFDFPNNGLNNMLGLQSSSSSAIKSVLQLTNVTYPGISFISQPQNLSPTNNKPHITLGCAPGVSAFVTGTDLLGIINFEKDFEKTSFDNATLTHRDGVTDFVVQYGEYWDAFVIYPQFKLIANATFQPYFKPKKSSGSYNMISSSTSILLVSFLILFPSFLLPKDS